MKLAAALHSVGELISTVLAGCQDAIRQRPINIEVSEEGSQILVDLRLAGSALGHLIQNANLYSAPGQPTTLSAEKRGHFLFLSVSDQGPWIVEEEKALIFEKCYRGKHRQSNVDRTGMGLPIAQAIVAAHG